jgi:hypothetical protein
VPHWILNASFVSCRGKNISNIKSYIECKDLIWIREEADYRMAGRERGLLGGCR